MFTPPTRSEKLTWTAFYGVITAGGVFVLALPPKTIESPLGDVITLLWGALLVVAIIPAIASVYGKFKWEYMALPPVIAGVLIYALTIWHLALDTPTRSAQAAMITALAIGLARRWLDRRKWVLQDKARTRSRADPESAAG